MVQQAFKQFAQWPLEDCVIKFYEKLATVWRFDIERFPCALGVSIYIIFIIWNRTVSTAKIQKKQKL